MFSSAKSPYFSEGHSKHREQPESNTRFDRAAVFESPVQIAGPFLFQLNANLAMTVNSDRPARQPGGRAPRRSRRGRRNLVLTVAEARESRWGTDCCIRPFPEADWYDAVKLAVQPQCRCCDCANMHRSHQEVAEEKERNLA